MAIYYVNAAGSETYPFDTIEKGAHGVVRLTKYLHSNNYKLFNHDVATGNIWQLTGEATDYPVLPPFPTGSEQVIFTIKINEHETYDRAEFSTLGTSRVTLGKYSFASLVEVDGEYWSQYVKYTHTIQYELVNIDPVITFTKLWDQEVSYIFVVTPTHLNMCINSTSNVIYSVAHGVANWKNLFNYEHYETRNGQPFYRQQVLAEYSTLGGGIRSVNRTHINTLESHLANPLATIPYTTDDIIYICGDVQDQGGLYAPDTIMTKKMSGASDTPFNGATICSWPVTSRNIWTISSNNSYSGLCFYNIEIDASSSSDTDFSRIPKDITGIICGAELILDDVSTNKIVIRDNIFYQDALIILDRAAEVDICNNQFTVGAGIELMGAPGLFRIFNNVFRDVESWACINVYSWEFDLNLLIANNTFYRMVETYSIMTTFGFSTPGYKLNLKIFNNIDVSLSTEGYGMFINVPFNLAPEDLIAFVHSNNCAPVYEYYDENYDEFSPDTTEILELPGGEYFDPSYIDPEDPFYPLILLKASPCYEAGLVSSDTPELDFLGSVRKTPPDMGAYETVEVALVADFEGTPLSGNQPLLVQFTDLSTPIGSITGWEWNFGDSTPHSTEQNPSHSYAFPGMYTVTLRVSNVFSDNQISKIHYIEVVYNAGEVEPESPDGGGFTRSRGPTLIFD